MFRQGSASQQKWWLCALLFLATTINYLDRQILSLLKPILDQELHWSNADYGLVNSAFQGAYAVGLIFFGWFIDRFGARIGYLVSIVLWSLAALFHMFAGSVGGFIVARLALGFGEGGNFPAAIRCIADGFPKEERSFATSIVNAGANVGAIVAPALVPMLAALYGWQTAFIVAGALGFVWTVAWLRVPKVQALESSPLQQEPDDNPSFPHLSSMDLLKLPETWAFIVAKFITDPVWWFFLIWLPDYFKQSHGLDIKKSWLHLVVIYGMVSALSLIGGWLPKYLQSRGISMARARKQCMFAFALSVLPVYFATAQGPWMTVFLIGLAGAAHQAWSANLFTTVSDMFPKPAIARVVGMGGMAGAIGGMIFPMVTGQLLDVYSKEGNITTAYTILFGCCSVAYIIAFALNHSLAPHFFPVTRPKSGDMEPTLAGQELGTEKQV